MSVIQKKCRQLFGVLGLNDQLRHAGPVTSNNQRLLDKLKTQSRVGCSDFC